MADGLEPHPLSGSLRHLAQHRSRNDPHRVNKESDKLIKEAVESPEAIQDQNKRKEIYAKWTEVVSEDVPYVFLYSLAYTEAWNKRVKGSTFRLARGHRAL